MTCAFPSSSDCYSAGKHCLLQKGLCPTGTYCGEPFCVYKSSQNHPPHITTSNDDQDSFIFYCEDADDNSHISACGCGKNAFYKFIDPSESCDSDLFHTGAVFHGSQVSGSQQKVSQGVRMEYSIPRSEFITGKTLCVGVLDNVGKYSVKKISFS
jgi:hypothetical protein